MKITGAPKMRSSRLWASSVGLSAGLSYKSDHQEEVSLHQCVLSLAILCENKTSVD